MGEDGMSRTEPNRSDTTFRAAFVRHATDGRGEKSFPTSARESNSFASGIA